jgi:hypothetical protein
LPDLIYAGKGKADLPPAAANGSSVQGFLRKRIPAQFPLTQLNPADPDLLWRDLMTTKRGREILETVTSAFALQRAGIFDPQLVGNLRILWLRLPKKTRMLRDVDPIMGHVIRRQILHELLVTHPVDAENPQIPRVPGKVELSEWELFVLRHTKGSNHGIHLLSALMFFLSPILAGVFWNPWYLIPFFLSGLVGTLGHVITHDGGVSLREATTQHKVPFYVLRMFYLIATGRYARELAAAKAKL